MPAGEEAGGVEIEGEELEGEELEGEVIEGEGDEPEPELVPEPEHSAEAEDVPPPVAPAAVQPEVDGAAVAPADPSHATAAAEVPAEEAGAEEEPRRASSRSPVVEVTEAPGSSLAAGPQDGTSIIPASGLGWDAAPTLTTPSPWLLDAVALDPFG
eukprot:EG_transcript_37518